MRSCSRRRLSELPSSGSASHGAIPARFTTPARKADGQHPGDRKLDAESLKWVDAGRRQLSLSRMSASQRTGWQMSDTVAPTVIARRLAEVFHFNGWCNGQLFVSPSHTDLHFQARSILIHRTKSALALGWVSLFAQDQSRIVCARACRGGIPKAVLNARLKEDSLEKPHS